MKKKIVGILICTLMIAATVLPVAGTGIKNPKSSSFRPAIGWEKTFGGNKIDWGCCVQQTFDGGYIISGTYGRNTWSPWQGYCYLLKINALGNEEWSQTQEVNDCWEVVGQCVQQTDDDGDGDKDDGYIIAGYTGFTWQIDVYLAKTDVDGETVWTRTFGKFEVFDRSNSVQQTTDGGYIIAGCTQSYGAGGSDVWLIKIDADGNEEWNQTFGGADLDSGNSVQQTSDGGYIIVGDTDSFGVEGDVYLIKTDASGNEKWSQTFGGIGWDGGYSVQQTTDDGFIITGWYTTNAGDHDVYLIKTDASGNEKWSQTFGGNNADEGYSVQQTTDGGYFITGYYNTHPVDWLPDVYLIKTDADGNEEWQHTLDKDGAEDVGYCGKQTSDKGYIITGHTGIYLDEAYDVWVIKLQGENQAPNIPDIDGHTGGKTGTEYEYTFVTTDPDNDDIAEYIVNWGDGPDETIIGPFASGSPATASHIWSAQGNYVITAKAKDVNALVGPEGTLSVTMPRNKVINTPFLNFLSSHPNLFPILTLLLQRLGLVF